MNCENCEKCGGSGWEVGVSGARRCGCAKGSSLAALDKLRSEDVPVVAPVVTEEQAKLAVAVMAAIPMFPADAIVRAVIGEEVRSLCADPGTAIWLAKRMVALYEKWPGPRELRRVYASRHIPHDRIMPVGMSEAHPDGIPPERTTKPGRPLICAGDRKLIDGDVGEPACAESQGIVDELVKQMPVMPKAYPANDRFSQLLELTVTAPCDRPESPAPTPQVVTQADVDILMAARRPRQ